MPQIPLYIPAEVCATVGDSPSTPPDQCMSKVLADVRDDGVAAPRGADIAGLRQVVADAKQKGIDLKVVVMSQSPPIDTPLRDIATEIGKANPGSTVLVISPGWAGTYSTSYDRVTLEAGQDVAKTASGNPVQATQNFVSQLQTPDFPWTALTIVLLIAVALATVLTRVLQVRGKRARQPEIKAETQPEPTA
ncbi:MAG: Rv1476 family membrane protein [Mycobacterium sp.]